MQPWETWLFQGGVNERTGRTLLDRMERLSMTPFGHKFGSQVVRLEDGSFVRLTINKNGPVPMYFARQISPQAAIASAPLFRFESGLLLLTSSGAGCLARNVSIGDDLSSYFAGTGTQILCGDSLHHIQGSAQSAATGCANPGLLWGEAPPGSEAWPVVNGAYASRIYVAGVDTSGLCARLEAERFGSEEPLTLSSRYSGLLRLGIQAWLACGRNPLDVCPFTGTDPSPDTDGLIYDSETFDFWWVRITGGSAVARPMANGAATEYLRVALAADEGTADQKEWALLVLMSDLSPANADEVEIIDDAGMAAFADAGSAISYGWKWSREAPWTAEIIVYKTNGSPTSAFDWDWTSCAIDFNFAEGVPTGDLTTATDQGVVSSVHPIWSKTGCAVVAPVGSTFSGASGATAYQVFPGVTARYVRQSSTSVAGTDTGEIYICGLGTGGRVITSSSTGVLGGWIVGDTDNSTSQAGTHTHTIRTVAHVYDSEEDQTYPGGQCTSAGTACSPTCAEAMAASVPSDATEWHIVSSVTTYGVRTKESRTRTRTRSGYSNFVIASGDAECAYIGRIVKWAVTADQSITNVTLTGRAMNTHATEMRYRGGPYGSEWVNIAASFDVPWGYSELFTWGGGEDTNIVNHPNSYEYEVDVKLVTPHGVFDVSGGNTEEAYGFWAQYTSASLLDPCSAPQRPVSQSYHGTGLRHYDWDDETIGGFEHSWSSRWMGRT